MARALANSACDVTLIDRQNFHLFQPLLYQFATAALSPADIALVVAAFSSFVNVHQRLPQSENKLSLYPAFREAA